MGGWRNISRSRIYFYYLKPDSYIYIYICICVYANLKEEELKKKKIMFTSMNYPIREPSVLLFGLLSDVSFSTISLNSDFRWYSVRFISNAKS